MSVPAFGGCVWPMDPSCRTDEWNRLPEPVQDLALAMASATLSRLTGYRVGSCPITIRPDSQQPFPRSCPPWMDGWGMGYLYGPMPLNWNGTWSNLACDISSGSRNEVQLPPPVGRVDEVKVDGNVLDTGDYRIDGNVLVWTGAGDAPWPQTQDMSLADTEPGTFSVTYLNAYPVDSLGAYAVGALATEFGKACVGNKCLLPQNVTTVVRQGLTLEVIAGSFPNGETGLRAVDSYIGLWNPKHRQQATVWNPNRPNPTRITA